MSVVMHKVTAQLLYDLDEANERSIKRFGEPGFVIDWETLEITYRPHQRRGLFKGSDNMPNDPEQAGWDRHDA